jgi:probable F420-dependent oxidoreductase
MGTTRPFRFSVQGANAASATEWTTMARRAEELGYSALHLSDHYLGPDGPPTGIQGLAAIPAMAAAAAVTSTLRIGCRVLCIDFHQPAVLAKEAATIDLLSDGRLELGLGAGWVVDEYEATGVAFDPVGVRINRLSEVIAFVKAYFSGEMIDVDGRDVHVHGYRGSPSPVQQPRPPIMIGGGAQRVLTLAGREADIVSLNFNNRGGVVGPDSVQTSTAEATDQRIQWIREGAGDRFDDIELEVASYFTVLTDDPAKVAEDLGGRFGVDGDTMRHHPNALFGSIGEICDELQARRERFGISYICVPTRAMEDFAPVVEQLNGK